MGTLTKVLKLLELQAVSFSFLSFLLWTFQELWIITYRNLRKDNIQRNKHYKIWGTRTKVLKLREILSISFAFPGFLFGTFQELWIATNSNLRKDNIKRNKHYKIWRTRTKVLKLRELPEISFPFSGFLFGTFQEFWIATYSNLRKDNIQINKHYKILGTRTKVLKLRELPAISFAFSDFLLRTFQELWAITYRNLRKEAHLLVYRN